MAVLSSFLFGYAICALNSCGGLIPLVFGWCDSDWQSECSTSRLYQGLVNASVYLGAALGSCIPGRPNVAARGGRFQMMLSDMLFIVGGLACASAQGVGALVFGRFVSGIGLGISNIAAPMYIAEVSPRERRGSNCTLVGVFIAVGIFASIALGVPQDPPPSSSDEHISGLNVWYWRILLGFPILPAALQLFLFRFVLPIDTPSFLIQNNQVQEARSLLYRSYGLPPPEAGTMDLKDHKGARLELQINELVEAATTAKAIPRIHVHQAIRDPFLRCALLLGFGLAAFQQLCGINALMSYSFSLFAEAGVAAPDLIFASMAMGAANVVVSCLSSKVVDNWGRRKLLLTGSFVQTLAMGIIVFGLDDLPPNLKGKITVGCFSLFCMAFTGGLGAITWLYLSEIYPMEIRGSALGACGVINWLSCFTVVFGGRFLTLNSSCRLFGMISGVGLVGVYLWVIETKGYSMDDSPLTPRSGRSSSTLLTPNPPSSPRGAFHKMEGDPEGSDEDAP